MDFDFTLSAPTPTSFRAAKVRGMFDVPATEVVERRIRGSLPIEDMPWSVGVIVGASGSGKSTIASRLFGDHLVSGFDWSPGCFLDSFPTACTPQQVVDALIAVGFSSPPSWQLPFAALSTGQKFRAELARAILSRDFLVYDEFTSVVDRTVAKAASWAAQKHVRRLGKRLIAVTCHRDVLEWLEPDWHYDTDSGEFGRCLWRRPPIRIDVRRGSPADWGAFRQHHYLSGDVHRSAQVYLAYVSLGDEPPRLAGFFSTISAMGMAGWRRGHRTVVLPDFQGLGIGNRMIELVAQALWDRQKLRFRATTSAPGIVRHRLACPDRWRLAFAPNMQTVQGKTKFKYQTSAGRLTTTWVYLPCGTGDSSKPSAKPTASR